MKRINIAILLTIILGTLLPLAGCQKKNTPAPASDSRQSRLTADENRTLKGQIKQLDSQIAKLNKDLADCNEEKVKIKKDAEDSVNFAMTTVLEEGKKEAQQVRDENEKLKAQIQKLEEELKQKK